MRSILFVFFVFFLTAFSCKDAESHRTEFESFSNADSASCRYTGYHYLWMKESKYVSDNSLCSRFPTPEKATRINEDSGSFAAWLRGLPLLPEGTKVHLYDGSLKLNQGAQAAVIDIDVGTKDLQQCADAVMRLRAEYLFATKQYDKISFNYTSGDKQDYARWVKGRRIEVKGNKTKEIWVEMRYSNIEDHGMLMMYLNDVFNYCGTLSLSREMRSIPLDSIMPGDVFIHGGSPGHAEIVLDVAADHETGKKYFMLAQSYMPAQQMHVLRDPQREGNDAWYALDFGTTLITPEYEFSSDELKRFQ